MGFHEDKDYGGSLAVCWDPGRRWQLIPLNQLKQGIVIKQHKHIYTKYFLKFKHDKCPFSLPIFLCRTQVLWGQGGVCSF